MQSEQNEKSIFTDVSIEGIDIEEGLRNFPAAVYMDVLRAWHKHFPGNADKMRSLVKELSDKEKLREYTIVAHGLKGSNYGIYADALGKEAENLEAAGRNGDIPFIEANNEPVLEKATALHTLLGAFIEANKEEAKDSPLASAPDVTLLAQFLYACKQFKSTTMEEILKQLEAFEYESGGELVRWLREQTDNLEYDAIQERLAKELK